MLHNSPKGLLDTVSKLMSESKTKYDQEQSELEAAQKALWEKKLSPKQKVIAAKAGDPKKIDAADFAALRKEEEEKKDESLDENTTVARKAAKEAHEKGLNDNDAYDHIAGALRKHYAGKNREGVDGAMTDLRIDRAQEAGMSHYGKLSDKKKPVKESSVLSKYIEMATTIDENTTVARKAAKEAHEKGLSDNDAYDHIASALHKHYAGKNREGAGGLMTDLRIDRAQEAGMSHYGKLSDKKKPVKESASIDEARGRPRKNPTGAATEDEPDQNIVMHLKKSVDTGGNHDVKFADKSTHKVPSHVASNVLHAMGKLKPADRLEIQKHIGQSHSNLMQVHGMIK